MASNPIEKLFDVTTAADIVQVDLDLSDIELSRYSRLEMQIELAPSYTTNVMIRLNGLSSGYVYAGTNSATYFGYLTVSQGNTPGICYFNVHIRPENADSKAALLTNGGYNYNAGGYYMGPGATWVSSLGAVKAINLISTSSTAKIGAGSKIIVYGVKR